MPEKMLVMQTMKTDRFSYVQIQVPNEGFSFMTAALPEEQMLVEQTKPIFLSHLASFQPPLLAL